MSDETWDDEQTSKKPEQVSFFLIKKENKFLTFIVYIYSNRQQQQRHV
jgi:hypothetical protein